MYQNDRSAPRMRKGEFSKMVITKKLYKSFLKEFPEYKDMTWRQFYDSWLEIAKEVRHEAIMNPLGVKLGSYLGELKLQYLPYKFKAIDPKTADGSEYININTKSKVGTIKWERRWAVKFNSILQFYAFDETRELHILAYPRTIENPETIRVARNTLGGVSVWRQKMKKE